MKRQENKNTLCVLGLGYIGLPTAAIFADAGFDVCGVDKNPEIVTSVNLGEVHFVEPEIDAIVARTVANGQLRAACDPSPADTFLIAVPTPVHGEDHTPELSYIEAAVGAIAPILEPGNLIVLESTSPVGTCERIAGWIADMRPDLHVPGPDANAPDIFICYCPERVLPGRIVSELIGNDRIIGGLDHASGQMAAAFYRHAVMGACIISDARTAELAKLTENSFRDVNIAFANEISTIADAVGVDVWNLIELANRHPRVDILRPGPGVGGHCIAVDPWFLINSAPQAAQLIRTARAVNDAKPGQVVTRVDQSMARLETTLSGRSPRLACLGLSFKADIDDLRESPALAIAQALATRHGPDLLVVEPYIDTLPDDLTDKATLVEIEEAFSKADLCVLLVDHSLFRWTDPPHGLEIIDTRGIWRDGQTGSDHAHPLALPPRGIVAAE